MFTKEHTLALLTSIIINLIFILLFFSSFCISSGKKETFIKVKLVSLPRTTSSKHRSLHKILHKGNKKTQKIVKKKKTNKVVKQKTTKKKIIKRKVKKKIIKKKPVRKEIINKKIVSKKMVKKVEKKVISEKKKEEKEAELSEKELEILKKKLLALEKIAAIKKKVREEIQFEKQKKENYKKENESKKTEGIAKKGREEGEGKKGKGKAEEEAEGLITGDYLILIKKILESNFELPVYLKDKKGLSATVEIKIGAGGKIVSYKFLKKSENGDFNRAVEKCLKISSPLPVDKEGRVVVEFKAEGIKSVK